MDVQEAVGQKNKAIQMLHGECAEKDKVARQSEAGMKDANEKLEVLREQLTLTQEALMGSEKDWQDQKTKLEKQVSSLEQNLQQMQLTATQYQAAYTQLHTQYMVHFLLSICFLTLINY